jgi:hypothetical protein
MHKNTALKYWNIHSWCKKFVNEFMLIKTNWIQNLGHKKCD